MVLRIRRSLAAAIALLVAAATAAVVTAAPAGATDGSGHARRSVEFDITGYRCELEVTDQRELPDGTVIVRNRQSGPTDASIALMDGTLEVTATAIIPPDRPGFTVGRWELRPDASTGTITGWFRGTVDAGERTELTSIGRGRDALRGVRVRMETTTPAPLDGAPCEADLAFTGSGHASAPDPRSPVGAVVTESTQSFAESVADVTAAIDDNPNLTLVTTIDHQAAAASRQLVLPPTTVLVFGNPRLGTPLMQASQTTGIDLPQKLLIWEDLLGVVRVAYNAPGYLQSRHGIEGADPQLETIAGALAGLAGVAAGTTVDPVIDAGRVPEAAGLVAVESDRPAAEAFTAIVDAVTAASPVNVALELEHDQNATDVGLDLRPTKLVVFGNPSLGTSLMQTDQSIALDLPQKILVIEDATGRTQILYNDPQFVARRHGVTGQDEVLATLDGALATFAAAGT